MRSAAAKRSSQPFVLLIADIGHFKHINDSFGHLVGDLVLKRVAYAMRGAAKRRLHGPQTEARSSYC